MIHRQLADSEASEHLPAGAGPQPCVRGCDALGASQRSADVEQPRRWRSGGQLIEVVGEQAAVAAPAAFVAGDEVASRITAVAAPVGPSGAVTAAAMIDRNVTSITVGAVASPRGCAFSDAGAAAGSVPAWGWPVTPWASVR
ncbi:MAG: hypothetical protein AB7Q27_22425 [Acidimicrobiia bacterium]